MPARRLARRESKRCHEQEAQERPTDDGGVREQPLPAPIWGREIIDPAAVRQLENAMRLPVTVGGALMPDAHVGYGVPIGGMVALEDAVAPYMVGVDIACRLMPSIFPGGDLALLENGSMREHTRYTTSASSSTPSGSRSMVNPAKP